MSCAFKIALFSLFFSVTSLIAVDTFPLDKLQPGMKGKTFTVLQGSEIVQLDTEILGVQRNGTGPGHSLIIARLIDERTKLIEAVHGMSGSPLYIDGKVVGALSRRLTSFEKDGTCGFTPIQDMLDVGSRKAPDGPPLAYLPTILKPTDISLFPQKNTSEYLSIPLTITGWNEKWRPVFDQLFGTSTPIIPLAGGSMDAAEAKSYPLDPGSALAAVLVSGDITMAGTGTLTWKDGDHILAFGHPMIGLGHVEFPLASAEIITVLASYYYPYKLSNTGKIAGTISEDRLSAISGTIGKMPELASYRITRTHEGQPRRTLQGGFVRHPQLVPRILAALLMETVMDEQDTSVDSTVEIEGTLEFNGIPPLRLDRIYSGGPETKSSLIVEQAMLFSDLYSVFPRNLEVKSLTLNMKTWEKGDSWSIKKISLPRTVVARASTIPITVTLVNMEGKEKDQVINYDLPEQVKESAFEVRVSSADDLINRDRSLINLRNNPDPDEVINILNRAYNHKAFYIETVQARPGMAVQGQAMTDLPPSILQVMTGGAAQKTEYTPLSETYWSRTEVAWPGIVEGTASARLKMK